ncbi:segregation and condensation protein A [Deinococcus soli (ex Cha et al. 2016)]|uniref:segregation and condensation protein A n=1 Tax=Deinococcus soli (ex Cha et al. 2016) TaxID=1309411 RepID=UPI001668C9A8|nr:ScpA family protein [Deinococcus soli (ex Cha et al. 2016)]GGB50145.1 segregation/condensation protein A [Deinococcus soli (ex Cha et al. 2016)]
MTAAPALPTPTPPPPAGVGFSVALPAFSGTLAELASALRTGRVQPGEVPLLTLTRDVLAWAQAVTGGPLEGAHPDLLPTLAAVIALKARLLLPQPEPDEPEAGGDWYDPLDDVLDGVEALAELGALVDFLAARRREREGLIPARAVPVTLPRRERPRNPQGSLAKLVKAAQNAVRQVEVPLLARDRLSLADALGALRAFGRRLRTFTFRGIPTQDWGEQTTYFAALLEGVKEGNFSVEQTDTYGDIQVQSHLAQD